MGDPDDGERLARLEERIARLKARDAPKPHQEEQFSQAQLAWRMVIELVTGLLIGFGMGYGLDSLLGTMPLFLVVFTLLGLAAGIRTMMRSAREVQELRHRAARDGTPAGAGSEGTEEKRVENGD
ncbi:MAG: AtpZ/AtpI family protein [Roseovarius sp.]